MTWVMGVSPLSLFIIGIINIRLSPKYRPHVAVLALIILCAQLGAHFLGDWRAADALSSWIYGVVLIFSVLSVAFSLPYVQHETDQGGWDNRRIALYYTFLFIFISGLIAVSLWDNYIFLWLAMEIVTLSSVVLVATVREIRPTEASWRYLFVTEAGGLLALTGTIVVVTSSGHHLGTWGFDPIPSSLGVHAAWALIGAYMAFVGYATKAGLAPFHTWLPDAHSEAPAPISALLSSLKLPLALLLSYRVFQLVQPIEPAMDLHGPFLIFGLLSLIIAAAFVGFQTDLKRLWAYSSIEHMGLISLGFGFGGIALLGAVLHILTHAANKTLLFFNAGAVRLQYHTSNSQEGARGLLTRTPWTGAFLAIGGAGIIGIPPLSVFWSEWLILMGGFQHVPDRWVAITAIALIVIIFIGIAWRLPQWLFTPGSVPPKQSQTTITESLPLLIISGAVSVLVIGIGLGAPLLAHPVWHHLLVHWVIPTTLGGK